MARMAFVKIMLLLTMAFILLVAIKQLLFPYKSANLVENIRDLSFSGQVEQVDQGRGLKVKLRGDSKIYVMDGTCNDSLCLAEVVTLGDSLIKNASSPVVVLKSKSQFKPQLFYVK
jgi:hypothetical protein